MSELPAIAPDSEFFDYCDVADEWYFDGVDEPISKVGWHHRKVISAVAIQEWEKYARKFPHRSMSMCLRSEDYRKKNKEIIESRNAVKAWQTWGGWDDE